MRRTLLKLLAGVVEVARLRAREGYAYLRP